MASRILATSTAAILAVSFGVSAGALYQVRDSMPAVASSGAERLAWLTGCWSAQSPGQIVEEQWMAARGGTLLGMGRTIRADTLLEYESILIRSKDGRLRYEAHPSGQEPAVFYETAASDTHAVFENPHHDFPQKIAYHLQAPDSLIAVVEGTLGGKHRAIQLRYQRAPCVGRRRI